MRVPDDAVRGADLLGQPALVRRYTLLDHDMAALGCLHGDAFGGEVETGLVDLMQVLSGLAEDAGHVDCGGARAKVQVGVATDEVSRRHYLIELTDLLRVHLVFEELAYHGHPICPERITQLRHIIALIEMPADHIAALLAARLIRETRHVEVDVFGGLGAHEARRRRPRHVRGHQILIAMVCLGSWTRHLRPRIRELGRRQKVLRLRRHARLRLALLVEREVEGALIA